MNTLDDDVWVDLDQNTRQQDKKESSFRTDTTDKRKVSPDRQLLIALRLDR